MSLSDSEREEYEKLKKEDSLSSMGDRPQSMAAHKLRRLMELEGKVISQVENKDLCRHGFKIGPVQTLQMGLDSETGYRCSCCKKIQTDSLSTGFLCFKCAEKEETFNVGIKRIFEKAGPNEITRPELIDFDIHIPDGRSIKCSDPFLKIDEELFIMSQILRWGGRSPIPINDLQHSIMVAEAMLFFGKCPRVGILHDIGETRTGDIPRPMKYAFPGLREYCSAVQSRAFIQFLKYEPRRDYYHGEDSFIEEIEKILFGHALPSSTWVGNPNIAMIKERHCSISTDMQKVIIAGFVDLYKKVLDWPLGIQLERACHLYTLPHRPIVKLPDEHDCGR